jgi:cytochrome b6-f complex iron-sulfur subunit
MEQNNHQPKRRDFLLYGFGASLTTFMGMILYPVFRFVMPPPTPESSQHSVKAANIKDLKPNSAKIFPFGSRPAILIRQADGSFRALSAICPHLNCTVQFREDRKIIWCACHNGQFDLAGKVIAGPPPRNLEEYDVNVQGEDVIVSKKA